MARPTKNNFDKSIGIEYHKLESLARVLLLPALQEYLSSEKGKEDYERHINSKELVEKTANCSSEEI